MANFGETRGTVGTTFASEDGKILLDSNAYLGTRYEKEKELLDVKQGFVVVDTNSGDLVIIKNRTATTLRENCLAHQFQVKMTRDGNSLFINNESGETGMYKVDLSNWKVKPLNIDDEYYYPYKTSTEWCTEPTVWAANRDILLNESGSLLFSPCIGYETHAYQRKPYWGFIHSEIVDTETDERKRISWPFNGVPNYPETFVSSPNLKFIAIKEMTDMGVNISTNLYDTIVYTPEGFFRISNSEDWRFSVEPGLLSNDGALLVTKGIVLEFKNGNYVVGRNPNSELFGVKVEKLDYPQQ